MKNPVLFSVMLSAFLSTACGGEAVQEPARSVAFDKQGHRGSRGLMPENTIPAMIKAIDLGVTTLEMDVVITADKKVLLSHDAHFNPLITTANDGRILTKENRDSFAIYRMTYDETQQFDVGLRPFAAFPRQEKIAVTKPLLSTLIDSVEAYIKLKNLPPVYYNIETKSSIKGDGVLHPAPAEFVDLLMQVINEKNIAPRTVIQSFDFRTLKALHQKYPDIRLSALVQDDKSVDAHLQDLGFVPAIYSPNTRLVNKELVEKCHRLNMKIVPWTANDKETIVALKKLGVDGIITDYPDLFN